MKINIVKFCAVAYIIALCFCMVTIWFTAFINPTKEVVVKINHFGEMWPELLQHFIGFTCILIWLIPPFIDWLKKSKHPFPS